MNPTSRHRHSIMTSDVEPDVTQTIHASTPSERPSGWVIARRIGLALLYLAAILGLGYFALLAWAIGIGPP